MSHAPEAKTRVSRFAVCVLIAIVALIVVQRLFSPLMSALNKAQSDAEQVAQEAERVNAELQEILKQMQQR